MNKTDRKPKIIIPAPDVRDARQAAADREAAYFGARALHFDRRARAFEFDLRSGVKLTIPVSMIPYFAEATPAQLATVTLYATGEAIALRDLDIDLSIAGIIRDAFGLGEIQQKRAGRVKTAAKSAAARENGKKGGRPPKNLQLANS